MRACYTFIGQLLLRDVQPVESGTQSGLDATPYPNKPKPLQNKYPDLASNYYIPKDPWFIRARLLKEGVKVPGKSITQHISSTGSFTYCDTLGHSLHIEVLLSEPRYQSSGVETSTGPIALPMEGISTPGLEGGSCGR